MRNDGRQSKTSSRPFRLLQQMYKPYPFLQGGFPPEHLAICCTIIDYCILHTALSIITNMPPRVCSYHTLQENVEEIPPPLMRSSSPPLSECIKDARRGDFNNCLILLRCLTIFNVFTLKTNPLRAW